MIPGLSKITGGGGQSQNFAAQRNIKAELEKFYDQPVAKVSIELVLTLVTVLFFAVFALRPTLTTMAELTREIEDKRLVSQELSKKVTALGTAQNEYFANEPRFDVLDDAVHDQPTLETALFYLEYLVRREDISLSGLRIETFPVGDLISGPDEEGASAASASGKPSKNEIGVYAIQASFEGDYENILAFFKVMESVRPLFSVESFNFSVSTTSDRETILRTNATIYMYGYERSTKAAQPSENSVGASPRLEEERG
jgi:hypothetical protein